MIDIVIAVLFVLLIQWYKNDKMQNVVGTHFYAEYNAFSLRKLSPLLLTTTTHMSSTRDISKNRKHKNDKSYFVWNINTRIIIFAYSMLYVHFWTLISIFYI